jgi:hypothetical protein
LLLSVTLRRAIEIIDRLKIAVAKAEVFLQLEAWVCVGCGIPHSKDSLSLLLVFYSKDACVRKIHVIYIVAMEYKYA